MQPWCSNYGDVRLVNPETELDRLEIQSIQEEPHESSESNLLRRFYMVEIILDALPQVAL